MDDLWPKDLEDLTKSSATAPVNILKEQAAILAKRTNGLIYAEVTLHDFPIRAKSFSYSFDIVAPALQNYRYELFRLKHGVEMYPVMFHIETEIKNEIQPEVHELKASNEEEFNKILWRVFNSKKGKQLLTALLKQSES
jgi:hypothetical protein